jgi:hypothetical protein
MPSHPADAEPNIPFRSTGALGKQIFLIAPRWTEKPLPEKPLPEKPLPEMPLSEKPLPEKPLPVPAEEGIANGIAHGEDGCLKTAEKVGYVAGLVKDIEIGKK